MGDYGITTNYIVKSASCNSYMILPFTYGGRWFLKVLTISGTSISLVKDTYVTIAVYYEQL